MSDIVNICAAIAGMSVTVGSVTPGVRNIGELRNTLKSSDTPLRMILTTTGDTEASPVAFIAMGKLQQITWALEDRLYWKPTAQGAGLLDNSEDIMLYIAAYAEAVRQNRSPTSQSHIVGLRALPATVEWPEGGTQFYGVRCILTIEEIVSNA